MIKSLLAHPLEQLEGPLGTLVIYIIWGFLRVTEKCHGDQGCPRADCVDGVISVVTMVCVMYDMYSD